MIYFLAVFMPPAAVYLRGKPSQAFINLLFTIVLWLPGVIHAVMVVNDSNKDKLRTSKFFI